MKTRLPMKTLFSLYSLGWTAAMPLMRRNARIADGFGQRTLKDGMLPAADLWIQSASAGEALLTAEILKNLDAPESSAILTTANTRQGLEILEKTAVGIGGDRPFSVTARFSPFDRPDLMKKAVSHVRPKLMVLVELEIWPGLLLALKEKGCPVLIVNGRLTERSLKRYMLAPELWKRLAPSTVFAMSDPDADRFRILFPQSRVETVPNIKFDRVPMCSLETPDRVSNPLATLAGPDAPLIVLGSVREEEEDAVARMIGKIMASIPDARIFLFPRHMHRLDAWKARLSEMNAGFSLRSARVSERPRIVLWDVFGELAHAYNLADAVFVGGSLAPLGGQNFLESLAAGVIPAIGPSWENFTWVGQGMVERGLLDVGRDWVEVAEMLIFRAKNPMDRDKVRTLTDDYIQPLRGGTRRVCDEIRRMLSEP